MTNLIRLFLVIYCRRTRGSKQEQGRLERRKNFITGGPDKHWKRFPRVAVQSPSLEVFKMQVVNLIWRVTLPWAGGWASLVSFQIEWFSNSVTLQDCRSGYHAVVPVKRMAKAPFPLGGNNKWEQCSWGMGMGTHVEGTQTYGVWVGIAWDDTKLQTKLILGIAGKSVPLQKYRMQITGSRNCIKSKGITDSPVIISNSVKREE